MNIQSVVCDYVTLASVSGTFSFIFKLIYEDLYISG